MNAPADAQNSVGRQQPNPSWTAKFLRDVFSILEMKFLFLLRGWYWFLIRPLVFPLGVLFWLQVMVPDDPMVNTRVLSGAIVFGVSISTANMLSQQIVLDRFLGRLNLLITLPISKSAFAISELIFSAVRGFTSTWAESSYRTPKLRQSIGSRTVPGPPVMSRIISFVPDCFCPVVPPVP